MLSDRPGPICFGTLLAVSAPSCAWAAPTDEPVEEVVVEETTAPDGAGAIVVPIDDRWTGADDVGDVLQTVPGANVRRLGGLGSFTGVSLRGSSFRQVQVHLDGIPLNPDGIAAVDLSELPLAAIREVRVYASRAPAIYGASPVGGVVDLRTAAAEGLRLSASMGSFDSWRLRGAGGVAGQLGRAPTDLLLGVDALGTSGRYAYLDDQGTRFVLDDDETRIREGADRIQLGTLTRWRVGDERLRWSLLDAFIHRDEGLPGPIGAPTPGQRLQTWRNLAVSSWTGRGGSVAPSGHLWHLVRHERVTGDGPARLDTFHTLGGHAALSAALRSWVTLGSSVQGRWERYQRVTDGSDAQLRGVFGAAVDAAFRLASGRLQLVPGVDLKVLTTEAATLAVANPSLGVAVEPGSGWTLRAHAAGGYRPPDLTELYGNRGAIVGNPELRPERSWGGDLGVAWTTPPRAAVALTVDVGGFGRWTAERITYIQNAQRTVVPVNVGAARVGGAWGAVDVAFGRWVEAGTRVTFTGSANLDTDPSVSGRPLPFVPMWQLDHRLFVGWEDWIRAGWTFHYTDGTTADVAGLALQAPRPLHGVVLRSRPVRGGPELELELRNVADLRTADVARDPLRPDGPTVPQPITDLVGFPLPGRTFWATIRWALGGSR